MIRLLGLTIGSVATVGGLAWLNWYWLETPLDTSPIKSTVTAASLWDEPLSNEQTDAKPSSALGEALTRPIFHSDRRPFVPPPPVAEEAPVEEEIPPPIQPSAEFAVAPQFRLAGISRFGGRKLALLGDETSESVQWYAEGDELQGWMISSIDGDSVTLTGGDDRVSIPLYPTLPDGQTQ